MLKTVTSSLLFFKFLACSLEMRKALTSTSSGIARMTEILPARGLLMATSLVWQISILIASYAGLTVVMSLFYAALGGLLRVALRLPLEYSLASRATSSHLEAPG